MRHSERIIHYSRGPSPHAQLRGHVPVKPHFIIKGPDHSTSFK